MNIAMSENVKWLINKASGWSLVTYVETSITKSKEGNTVTETRRELNFTPKKANHEWFGAFGECIVKVIPYITIAVIAVSISAMFILKTK